MATRMIMFSATVRYGDKRCCCNSSSSIMSFPLLYYCYFFVPCPDRMVFVMLQGIGVYCSLEALFGSFAMLRFLVCWFYLLVLRRNM